MGPTYKNKDLGIILDNNDCLLSMKNIPDGSVDMILCDLPYGTTACKWDTVIPFEPLWEQYKRIIKFNGAIALFGSEPFSTELRYSNLEMFKYDWIWHKNSGIGFQHSKNMPLKRHEIISIFSKAPMGHKSLLGDRRMMYNPQGVICDNKIKKVGKKSKLLGDRPNQDGKEYVSYSNFPISVLQFDNSNKDNFHPTQKPVALLEYLIKTYTNEGEIVLDNCMGSGSTGIACIKLNRKFIGIEIDEEYYKIAKQRILKEKIIK